MWIFRYIGAASFIIIAFLGFPIWLLYVAYVIITRLFLRWLEVLDNYFTF